MKERKTGKGQIFAIIILVLLLIANCSYIVYDKLYLKNKSHLINYESEEEKEENEEIEVKSRSLSFAEKKILLEQIEAYNNVLSISYPIVDIKTFDNQQKLLFAYVNSGVSGQKEFMQGDLRKVIDAYFGKDSDTNYENINCFNNDGVFYVYDEARRTYTLEGMHGHDGLPSYSTTNYYLDGTVTNEKEYKVNVQIIYHRYCGGTCGPALNFYKSAHDARDKINTVLKLEEERELTENDYESIKEKLDITTFLFEKDSNGNFGLKSVRINN